MLELTERVTAFALALGFHRVGIADASEPLTRDYDHYRSFVDDGLHGQMEWLRDQAEERLRLDGASILPGARSVVCVGLRYGRSSEEEARDPALARLMARYGRGQDYHNHLRKKLRRLAAFVRDLAPGIEARPLCDVEPLLERAWAVRAGLGFVGKNGLLITPGQGSYQLLGEVVTTLPLVPALPLAERCGACTRCLDACPTSAFARPFVLDPRRCIAYWTIEARGLPPEELRDAIGAHLFGCDVCQEVCPFNRAAPPPIEQVQRFVPLAKWSQTVLPELVEASSNQQHWKGVALGTPLHRCGALGLARNALLVAARRLATGEVDASSSQEALEALRAAMAHEDPELRQLAAWGLARARGLPSAVP